MLQEVDVFRAVRRGNGVCDLLVGGDTLPEGEERPVAVKDAHPLLGDNPATEGLDFKVQQLGEGGYGAMNVVVVQASVKLGECHCPENNLVKETAPGTGFLART